MALRYLIPLNITNTTMAPSTIHRCQRHLAFAPLVRISHCYGYGVWLGGMAMAMAMHLLDSPKDIRYGSHSNQDNHQLWSDGMGRICNLLLMESGIWDLEVWCVTSEMSQRARASLLQLFCQRLVPAPGCCILRVPLQCRVQLQYTLRSGPLVRLRAPPSPSSLAPLHSTDEIHSRRRQIIWHDFDYSQHHHTVARLEEKKKQAACAAPRHGTV